MQETWVRSLGWEDPVEKEMATHSSILAWKIPWTEEPGTLRSTRSQSQTWLSDFTNAMTLVFWILSFQPTFSLSSSFIKRLFSSSSLSAIRMVSSAYLRLRIFLRAILIPAWASFSPSFPMMYSAYELNKQGDNMQPWCTVFPILNQSFVPCLVLTVASWPAYRFLRRQVRCSGIPISLRIFHSLLWSTQSKAIV